ncbi:hypothetical protein OG906_04520 [Streptomyces sp. NBC_01426]|uniref:hypothetical protein n=1 Tax=Streptomyces sp. NBC_01426 TaxID=2975866 RepID=UPI002E302CA3|nr:hypothetical protein [Streptomyces sp. NBC_01426]
MMAPPAPARRSALRSTDGDLPSRAGAVRHDSWQREDGPTPCAGEARAAGSAKAGTAKGTAASTPGGKKQHAARKRARSVPEAAELGSLSTSDLYKKATTAEIPGRSTMTRDELLRALAA